jgi:pyrroloquinoline quinone (PQQ) biosynthesis protein C
MLIAEVADRYAAAGRPELEQFARRKLEEEQGHDQLALDDLEALGYDGASLVRTVISPVVRAVVEYARSCARGEHPVDFLGYIHVIERDVTRLTADWFAALDAVLPAGVDAASGLRSHATDLDHGHVAEGLAFFASLSAGDRTRVALACHRTMQILKTPLPGQYPSEADLERQFSRFELKHLESAADMPLE